MAKMVGLSRNIKLQWLNKVVELVREGLSEKEIKESLNEYLSFEIESPTNIRKTREILMNIWVYENDQLKKIKPYALDLINKHSEYSLEIHWCMMMAAYPVFVDMCKLIGKISEFQDEITLAQLKQKLFDDWGERTTLYHSIDKLVSTLKAFGVIQSNKPGKYQINKHKVSNSTIVAFMAYSVMTIDDNGYYTISDIHSTNCFFPFEYLLEKETIYEDERFSINNFGGEMSVSLND